MSACTEVKNNQLTGVMMMMIVLNTFYVSPFVIQALMDSFK